LSIPKTNCENYLSKDYHLKSGIAISILALRTSGSYPHLPEKAAGQDADLKSSPTYLQYQDDLAVNDYRKKATKKAEPFDPAFYSQQLISI
jgi:hypothetical protein